MKGYFKVYYDTEREGLGLVGTDLLVYSFILSFPEGYSDGVDNIAKALRITEKSVYASLKRLVATQLIFREVLWRHVSYSVNKVFSPVNFSGENFSTVNFSTVNSSTVNSSTVKFSGEKISGEVTAESDCITDTFSEEITLSEHFSHESGETAEKRDEEKEKKKSNIKENKVKEAEKEENVLKENFSEEKISDRKETSEPVKAKSGQTPKVETVLPYSSERFVAAWKELILQPKWRKKSPSALQKSANKLKPYSEEFCLVLIDDAIANDYQGIVFSNTQQRYEQWLWNQLRNPTNPATANKPRKTIQQEIAELK